MRTLTELQDLLREKYDVDATQVTPEANLQDGGLDSLAIAEFMFAVEDHFHISLPDDDPNINTLAQLADLIDRVRSTHADGTVAHANGGSRVEPASISSSASDDAVIAPDETSTGRSPVTEHK